jgi:cell division protein ZapB
MEHESVTRKTERYITALEERVDELIRVYEALLEENRSLQAQHAELQQERDALIEQNEQSRMRIEAMVVRLKGLEQTP